MTPSASGLTPALEEATLLPKPALSPSADAFRRLRRNPIAILSGGYILVLIFIALFAPHLTPYDFAFQDTARYTNPPTFPDAKHLLGTDETARDLLSRILYGARVSLGVASVVIFVEVLIGVTLGLIAGYRGGRTDALLMRFTDVMFAFPDLLLAILLTAILRSGGQAVNPAVSIGTLFLALGIVGWPSMARLVRGQALALRQKEFVEAARAIGVKERTILLRHLLPNLSSPIIVQATQDAAAVILAEATLSYLGLGVQQPIPSWGRMVLDGQSYMQSKPFLLIVPGLALAFTVMAFNFFGDALRDALDPRLRQ